MTHVNVTDNCPQLDCPEQTVPMGKCCPVCLCKLVSYDVGLASDWRCEVEV